VRRISAALGTIALLASLAACGDKSDDAGDTSGLGAVTVTGDFGKAPAVVWNGQATTDTLASTTLIEGEGETIANGDTVKVDLWIGNGFSQAQAYSSWKNGKSETIKLTDQVSKGILDAIVGHEVGSRVLVVAPPADAFGDQGQASLGIGNSDDVVFVVDIDAKIVVLDGPQGAEQTPPPGAPKLVEKNDVPTGFDFSASPATPAKKLQVFTLIKGDGAKVEKGQTITVNYLGAIYGTDKVFDQSYDGTPASFSIGTGAVIKGWDDALVGRPIGSRVILSIPPDLGYGDAGQSGAGIKGTDTLVFVVDILSAS
jgi:peptidylprolyl isomerase